MKDTYWHKGMRQKLVEALRLKGISDEKVLAAIQLIPRHFFLDNAFEELAYQDKALPIGKEQTISQPYTVAIQTSLLDIQPNEKVLEIGTGSAYQATILAALGATVYTIERQESLYKKAQQLITKLKIKGVFPHFGDGYEGLVRFAPYDKIVVTAGAEQIPTRLVEQLKIGGKMVIPVGNAAQSMLVVNKKSEQEFSVEDQGRFRFVPFVEGVVKISSNV